MIEFLGLFRQVPKIGYLGNPKRDFFVRDPNNYEQALLQYSSLEIDWARHVLQARQLNHAD